jgi:hypothetical protein
MNLTASHIIISASVTLLSMIVSVVSFLSLQSEEGSRQLILASIPQHPTEYTLKQTTGSKSCVGTIHVSLDSTSNQASLRMEGWMMVSLFGRQEPLELDATLVFNALGQLSVSIFRTTIQGESFRFGTTGVNPMTVQMYRGGAGAKPLLQQTLPGPIELRGGKDVYQLVAPQLTALRKATSAPPSPFSFEQTETTSCRKENAHALDLTPYLHLATALSEHLRRIMPNL